VFGRHDATGNTVPSTVCVSVPSRGTHWSASDDAEARVRLRDTLGLAMRECLGNSSVGGVELEGVGVFLGGSLVWWGLGGVEGEIWR
jgi:hypothetical protein